ncbi:hypothetical protein [Rhizobium sp. P38BS-XIX]|uniref:hypothetical protein n=1 Tax=Rhizobium sp. P38BS-XIX TaxID=2726740 RepID=UPI001FEFE183|nr:hypothetical protein [Rhizobium sp. P38BS-XIX]
MDWITRHIDHPLLEGASASLRAWHSWTGRPPEHLEPVWNLAVLGALFVATGHLLSGNALALSVAAIIMLSLPSGLKLLAAFRKGGHPYGVREYKLLRAQAIFNRDTRWTLRLMVLIAAGCLPFFSQISDPIGAMFMLGASLWFVLTAPAKFYLEAAEPPVPHDGDPIYRGNLQLG